MNQIKINPIYTNKETMNQIKTFYNENGFVQLENFTIGNIKNLEDIELTHINEPLYQSKKINKEIKIEIEDFKNFIKATYCFKC